MKNSYLQLLLSRLSWPSIMARERAASVIAGLLVGTEASNEVLAALLDWMAQQTYESVAAIGIVVLIRARDIDNLFVPPRDFDIDVALTAPSLLSDLLKSDLSENKNTEMVASRARHSNTAPSSFSSNPLFARHVETYVPPIYHHHAIKIEKRLGIPFLRQWEYETDIHLGRAEITLPYFTHNHWMSNQPDEHASHSTPISEAYRSGYLRAIAWGLAKGFLSQDEAIDLVMHTCPLDLSLWSVLPQARPDWWPSIPSATCTVDVLVPTVWQTMNKLWQARKTMFGTKELAYADGFVGVIGDTVYTLQIILLAQQAYGPRRPEPTQVQKEAFVCYQHVIQESPLRYVGYVPRISPNNWDFYCEDWAFLPLAVGVPPEAVPFWQNWRIPNYVAWLPPGYLTDSPMHFSCSRSAVHVHSEGKSIAQWQDWNESVTERRHPYLPVHRGSYLLVDREHINRFAQRNGASLCWLCCLTIYTPTDKYEYEVTIDSVSELLGGTPIVKPRNSTSTKRSMRP